MEKNCPPQPATAKKLLKEAGYPDGIDMTIHVSTKEPTWPTIAEVLQQQLAKANIRADIQMTPSKSYWNETWMKKAVAMTRWNERPADSILLKLIIVKQNGTSLSIKVHLLTKI